MKRYGIRRRRSRLNINFKRLGLVAGVAAGAVVAIVLGVNAFSDAKDVPEETPAPVQAEVFEQGVTVGGVDVSGLTLDEARLAVQPAVSQMTQDTIEFTVRPVAMAETAASSQPDEGEDTGSDEGAEDSTDTGDDASAGDEGTGGEGADSQEMAPLQDTEEGQKYTFTLDQLGVSVDAEPVLAEAMAFRRTVMTGDEDEGGGLFGFGKDEEEEPTPAPQFDVVDFPLEKTLDDSMLETTITDLAQNSNWDVEPINSNHKVQTWKDEDSRKTGGEMVETEPTDGWRVKTEDIIGTIKTQIETAQYAPFEAQGETVPAQASGDAGKQIVKMATASTEIKKRQDGRTYNIFKISDILNGAVFMPGVNYSVNGVVGDRTEANGWRLAPGIEEGIFTDQAGGGICQVSSTMYNASLKAEMDQVSRVPHSIMADYVIPGFDATISTGGPDYETRNPYDDPLYMIVFCDIPNSRVTVEIWGYEQRDYYVELYSEIDWQEETAPAPEFKVNSGLNSLAINEVKRSRAGKKYQLYKRYMNRETDEVMEDGLEVGTSTYPKVTGLYEVGSSVPYSSGMTYEQVKAARDAISGSQAPPDSGEGDDPNASPEPTETPTDPPSDNSGGNNSGGNNSGGDNSNGNNSGGDNSGGDNSGGDNSGGDNSGGDNSGGDDSGGDGSGGDGSGGDDTGGETPPVEGDAAEG